MRRAQLGAAECLRAVAASATHCVRTFAQICGRIERRSPAAQVASRTALAVVVTVLIVCAMDLRDVWWAAISAYISVNPVSVARGLRRILGTIAGAALAVMLIEWLAYDSIACCLALFCTTAAGTIGFNISRHGYGWLFASITFGMVVLASLPDPAGAFSLAVDRSIEVVIGTSVAVAIGLVLAPGTGSTPTPTRNWSDLLGREWPVSLYALRSGLTVALIPIVWSAFVLPGASQMAVTLAAVQATPVLADLAEVRRRVAGRGLQRLVGCFVGGLSALMLIGLGFDALLPWLVALACGVWLFAYAQYGTHDVTYVGTQAGVVFIMTLVQGNGPPDSILPGIDRFTGISLGLLVLCFVQAVIGPVRPLDGAQAAARSTV